MPHDDRRRVARIRLAEPLPARLGHLGAQLLEIGLLGARIELDEPLNVGARSTLTFAWGEETVVFECVVARCDLQDILTQTRGRSIYHSGLTIERARGESGVVLKRMIAAHVTRALEEQKANARGDLAPWVQRVPFFSSWPATKPTAPPTPQEGAIYLSCRFSRGEWRKTPVYKPKQPLDGFTVSAAVDEAELDLLCKSYESADDAARQLIRLCAEMSLAADDPVPPSRYQP
ncbi:MAG TPA: hypothetical protein VIL97_10150 [Thermoanaerobaculia bacterium]